MSFTHHIWCNIVNDSETRQKAVEKENIKAMKTELCILKGKSQLIKLFQSTW
jgi:hypothetical protein